MDTGGDPVEITVRVVQLLCMLFGMTAQCFTGDTLVATEEGLIPIEDVKAGDYVWSENTEAGDLLRTESGCRESVRGVSIERVEEPVRVWNLEIEGQHTYFVGENKILVHNNCPNPDGKKGGQSHRDKINEITSERGKIVYEQMYDTTGGYKKRRFADAVEMVNGVITKIYQVGKVNNNGMPVVREVRAIEDIMKSADYNGAPIFFIPYNFDIGEIIYDY